MKGRTLLGHRGLSCCRLLPLNSGGSCRRTRLPTPSKTQKGGHLCLLATLSTSLDFATEAAVVALWPSFTDTNRLCDCCNGGCVTVLSNLKRSSLTKRLSGPRRPIFANRHCEIGFCRDNVDVLLHDALRNALSGIDLDHLKVVLRDLLAFLLHFRKEGPHCGPSCRSAGPTVPERAQWAQASAAKTAWLQRGRTNFCKSTKTHSACLNRGEADSTGTAITLSLSLTHSHCLSLSQTLAHVRAVFCAHVRALGVTACAHLFNVGDWGDGHT